MHQQKGLKFTTIECLVWLSDLKGTFQIPWTRCAGKVDKVDKDNVDTTDKDKVDKDKADKDKVDREDVARDKVDTNKVDKVDKWRFIHRFLPIFPPLLWQLFADFFTNLFANFFDNVFAVLLDTFAVFSH